MSQKQDKERIDALARAEAMLRYYQDVKERYADRRAEIDRQLAPLLRLSERLDTDYARADEAITECRGLIQKRRKRAANGNKLDQLRRLRAQVLRLEEYAEGKGLTEEQINQLR